MGQLSEMSAPVGFIEKSEIPVRFVGPDVLEPPHHLFEVIQEEEEHHGRSAARLAANSWWGRIIDPIVAASTEAVIWMGMRL
jgi:ubiquinone biosynthesis monooxygenase Coq7